MREWACETVHTLNNSSHAYRLILIRKKCLQDDLFYVPYRYRAIITNMDMPLEEQIAWYRRRGQSENLIKELKWDFELRCLPSGDFFVNALYLRIVMPACNLFLALKLMVLTMSCHSCRLKRLSYQLLRIPALVVYHAAPAVLEVAPNPSTSGGVSRLFHLTHGSVPYRQQGKRAPEISGDCSRISLRAQNSSNCRH